MGNDTSEWGTAVDEEEMLEFLDVFYQLPDMTAQGKYQIIPGSDLGCGLFKEWILGPQSKRRDEAYRGPTGDKLKGP